MSAGNALEDEPFSFRETADGRVLIDCRGRSAKILTGDRARRFLARVRNADAQAAQLLMAKATGQFKFGNER